MEKNIQITSERIGVVEAELLEDRNPATVKAIWEDLPFEAQANTWGDEIYFEIPVSLSEENAQKTVESGDLGYWPSGKCFCIFFGPTPISQGNEIRPASAVNVFGKVKGNPRILTKVISGDKVRAEKAD